MTAAIIIGYRDRGTDPLRRANLDYVLDYWKPYGLPIHVVDDGRQGNEQFNRHAAYNKGAAQTDADILCFVESDMIIPFARMDTAIDWATHQPGLVVPFEERHEFGPRESEAIREGRLDYRTARADIIKPKPRRTGAINVISRHTFDLVGRYDEAFEGHGWDDRSMHIAFDRCAGPTRWLDGPSWHLYHLPGFGGQHLSPQDKAATERNRRRFRLYQLADAQGIRELTSEPNRTPQIPA